MNDPLLGKFMCRGGISLRLVQGMGPSRVLVKRKFQVLYFRCLSLYGFTFQGFVFQEFLFLAFVFQDFGFKVLF